MTDWLKEKWCGLFHGGNTILRDCYERINWQCVSCGRWSIPVDKQTEKLMTEAAIAKATGEQA